MPRPFIYIAALRRTGSTVLAEALTELPHCFIFREPGLARHDFRLHRADVRTFRRLGVKLTALRRRWRRGGGCSVRRFRDELLPRLPQVAQIGVKEIFHEGWQHYLECFPEARVVLTGRDPRDIYVSLAHRVRRRRGIWSGPLTPERVAGALLREFRRQREIAGAVECLRVRYEDLCRDRAVLQTVKAFVDSAVPGAGKIGAFNASNPRRRGEAALHEGRITDRRVGRWQTEPEAGLRDAAERTFALMDEYAAYWGYGRDSAASGPGEA